MREVRKLQKYKQKQSPYVQAIQFFHNNPPPATIVQKVWVDIFSGFYVKNKKDRKVENLYTERYIAKGGSEFLEDGDWLILYPSGYVYREPKNRRFNATFRKVTTKKRRKK